MFGLSRGDSAENRSPWVNFAYYICVVVLVASLALMYLHWRNRQKQFISMRDQISQTEETVEIQARRADELATDEEAGNQP